jgi:hypothetical protein
MLGGMESARSLVHLCELLVLADRAGVLARPISRRPVPQLVRGRRQKSS